MGLGRETIAECVESSELEAFLRTQGIDHARASTSAVRRRRPSARSAAPEVRRRVH
jgi:hypothetical protein